MEILLEFIQPFVNILPKLPEVLIDLLVGYLVIKALVWIFEKFLRLANLPKLKGILVSLMSFSLWVVLIIIIANSLGFNRLAIAISSSVLVLVFFLNNGLGPLIMDISSGIFLCGDPDFRTGSKIRVGAGEDAIEGRIMEVDMRKTRLKDDDGRIHVFPNAMLDREQWTVLEHHQSKVAEKATVVKEKAKEVINNKIKNNG